MTPSPSHSPIAVTPGDAATLLLTFTFTCQGQIKINYRKLRFCCRFVARVGTLLPDHHDAFYACDDGFSSTHVHPIWNVTVQFHIVAAADTRNGRFKCKIIDYSLQINRIESKISAIGWWRFPLSNLSTLVPWSYDGGNERVQSFTELQTGVQKMHFFVPNHSVHSDGDERKSDASEPNPVLRGESVSVHWCKTVGFNNHWKKAYFSHSCIALINFNLGVHLPGSRFNNFLRILKKFDL